MTLGPFDARLGDDEALATIAESLAFKGFAVLDASSKDRLAQDALGEAYDFKKGRFAAPPSGQLPDVDVAEGLLGHEGSKRIAEVRPAGDGEALRELDALVGDLGVSTAAFLPVLGFSRSAGLLHESKSFGTAAARDLDEESAVQWLREFARHRLMVVYFLGPDEGVLELKPHGEEAEVCTVSTGPNVVVLLRADALHREHRVVEPDGKAFALSCFLQASREDRATPEVPYLLNLHQWFMERLKDIQEAGRSVPLDGLPPQLAQAASPAFNKGQQACIRGMACHYPGPAGWQSFGAVSQCVLGGDFVVEVPNSRFDIDNQFYANPKDELWTMYKTYSKHGSFIDGAELFDNKAFAVPEREMAGKPVSERWGLEVGYEAIFAAGWNKKSLQRLKADVLVGEHTTENVLASRCPETAATNRAAGSQAREANYISFALNLMGQSLVFDTDGSSSFAALWHGESETVNDEGRSPPFALIFSAAWNTSPVNFANFCSRRFLSPGGRCFCFNEGADGFVRMEGAGAVVLTKLYKMVEDEPVLESHGLGMIRACEVQQAGGTVGVLAPSGSCMHEVMALSLRRAELQKAEVDAVECHAHGMALADAVEAAAIGRVLRGAGSAKPLPITDIKTNYGSGYAAAGLMALIKVIAGTLRATMTGNTMLRQLGHHVPKETEQGPVAFLTEPLAHPLSSSGFTGINSFGTSGTYVNTIVWADVRENQASQEEGLFRTPPVAFWPGGGGRLAEEDQPSSGYYIAGTFSQWAEPRPMQEEAEGEWTAVVTLGENRWELFQIWLDGDVARALHPGRPKARSRSAALGPEEHDECRTSSWLLDGRGPPGGSFSDDPGQRYKVRLLIAGKYRAVEWERVEGEARLGEVPEAPPSHYCVAGSWANWAALAMTQDDAQPGLWVLEARLESGFADFLILRNGDWQQQLYPEGDGTDQSAAVVGPDDGGLGFAWSINGEPGDVFRIEFRRAVGPGRDDRQVTWHRVAGSPPEPH